MESRHRHLEALFLAAAELPAAERAAFLDARCGGDTGLRAELEDLLARDSAGSGVPDHPLVSVHPAPPPDRLGPYVLGAKLGEGGFGEVFAAQQTEPVRRRVAIKVLKPGLDSRAVLARFEAERHTLALMDHPGIARVLDAGALPSGRPYFVMERVDGQPITDFCDAAAADLRTRLELFVSVCRAVEHAHRKGVIHRDLKPSNLLVTRVDGRPAPKVIDFGIAKAIAPGAEAEAVANADTYTRAGDLLGTPEYMSPEQSGSRGADVDTRTDVYSLGVVLYRLLAGRAPFDPGRLGRASPAEVQRILAEEEPRRPSEVATTTPARALRGDLDRIVLRALEKDRERRYPSAAALADDVERHLRHEPVVAGPPSARYRLRKLARRHRGAVVAGGVAAAALLAGVVATTTQAVRATRAEEAARREAAAANAVSAFLTGMLAAGNPLAEARGREVPVRELLDRAARALDESAPPVPAVEAGVRHALGTTYAGLGLYAEAEPHLVRAAALRTEAAGPASAAALDSRFALVELQALAGRNAAAESALVAIAADARTVLAADPGRCARFLSLRGGVLGNLSRFAEADSAYAEEVALRRAAPDAGGADGQAALAAALGARAEISRRLGRFAEAETLAVESVALARRARPGDHHDTAAALARLASVRHRAGRLPDADVAGAEAVAMGERVLGAEHPLVAEWVANLAQIRLDAGDLDGAEAAARQAVARADAVGLGPERANPLRSTLATVLAARGDLDAVLALRQRILASSRARFGDVHAAVASDWNNLGATYRLLHRWADAESAFASALGCFRTLHGEDHPDAVVALHNLGKTRLDAGRFAEAERTAAEAASRAARAFPERHPTRAIITGAHGRCLAAIGRTAEARASLTAAIDELTAALGADHPRTRELADALDRLAR